MGACSAPPLLQERRDARLETSCKPQKFAERASQPARELGHSQLLHRDVQAPIPTKTRSATSVTRISCVRYGLRARLQEATDGGRPYGSGGDPALPWAHLADTLTKPPILPTADALGHGG
ncbi:unnamed protein product [Sphagnum balticum]